ncbi:MAG TPA: response regulator, partial [Herpetosiphonaceae bacterium]|nr:response regulator [Herpetosiphonaceae bacterium]
EQPFDVRECIEAALDVLARPAAQKGLDLGVLIEANTPTAIIGDEVRLRQILVNLLSNAVKFTARGEVVVTVSLAPGDGDGQPGQRLQFAVSDTGIGIAEHQRDRLFQSFSQIDASTTRKYGGTGLGLAISKRMSELMGGTMWVESQIDHGSTFFFTIQAQPAPEANSVYMSRSQPQLQNKRVLVVDDSATSRATIVTQAGTWGMACFEAASGAEALAMIEAGERFDLAILDLHMPEMDGLTLAARLRERHPAAALPLVMITGLHIQEEDPRLAEFAGFLSKPVKASQLYNTLLAIFAQRGQAFYIPEHEHNEFDGGLGSRQPLSILLVEDNLINQKVALLTLERLGYQAAVANNGGEAVAAVQREPYTVVLMDMHMPEMDGLEATRRIRRLPALAAGRQPYIIALTANAIQGDRELCLAAGMDDYISKPLQVAALRAALERAHQNTGAWAPAGPDNGAIDQAALDELGAAAPELIGLFLDEAPALLATMRAAVERDEPVRLREAAHNLKGSSQYLGALAVADLSQRLELMGRSGSLAGADTALTELERALSAAKQALASSPEDGA